eukprot:TRINITY_DN10797_c0_g1_i1.p1 TRINITY_DN10797_c0_g1~~TRINITY_DN10797_c0_g1_i1.p1  ORF type:complete len:567 (+),score=167.82 TRINITY_DN10797_c0_g1_i1:164-1864(+)
MTSCGRGRRGVSVLCLGLLAQRAAGARPTSLDVSDEVDPVAPAFRLSAEARKRRAGRWDAVLSAGVTGSALLESGADADAGRQSQQLEQSAYRLLTATEAPGDGETPLQTTPTPGEEKPGGVFDGATPGEGTNKDAATAEQDARQNGEADIAAHEEALAAKEANALMGPAPKAKATDEARLAEDAEAKAAAEAAALHKATRGHSKAAVPRSEDMLSAPEDPSVDRTPQETLPEPKAAEQRDTSAKSTERNLKNTLSELEAAGQRDTSAKSSKRKPLETRPEQEAEEQRDTSAKLNERPPPDTLSEHGGEEQLGEERLSQDDAHDTLDPVAEDERRIEHDGSLDVEHTPIDDGSQAAAAGTSATHQKMKYASFDRWEHKEKGQKIAFDQLAKAGEKAKTEATAYAKGLKTLLDGDKDFVQAVASLRKHAEKRSAGEADKVLGVLKPGKQVLATEKAAEQAVNNIRASTGTEDHEGVEPEASGAEHDAARKDNKPARNAGAAEHTSDDEPWGAWQTMSEDTAASLETESALIEDHGSSVSAADDNITAANAAASVLAAGVPGSSGGVY